MKQVKKITEERVAGLTGSQAVYAVALELGHGWARGLDKFLTYSEPPYGNLVLPRIVRGDPRRFFPYAPGVQELQEALELYERLWTDGKGRLEPFLEASLGDTRPFWRAIADDMAMVWHPGVVLEDGVYSWSHRSAQGRIRAHISWLPGGVPWWGVVVVSRPQGPALILHLRGDEKATMVGLYRGTAPAGSRHWDWAAYLARAFNARQAEEHAHQMMEVAREAELAFPHARGGDEEEVEG